MQVFGLHKNIYKLERYGRTQELSQKEALKRQKVLGDWETLRAHKVPDKEIARITGISRSVYYRRKKDLSLRLERS